MAHTVRMPQLPKTHNGHAGSGEPLVSLALWLPRAAGSGPVAAAVTRTALTAMGIPAPQAEHVADAAWAASRHLIERSAARRYQVLLSVDDAWCVVAATDYSSPPPASPPAWLPVPADAEPPPNGGPAWAARDGDTEGLEVHRTPDGQFRVRCRVARHEGAPATGEPTGAGADGAGAVNGAGAGAAASPAPAQ